MDVVKQQKALSRAILTIKKGGVIVCPTDTVYGFLADASNKKAVEKIYKIKKRAKSKPLPLFVKDFKMAKGLAEIDARREKIITLRLRSGQAKYWPGKFTFVFKRKKGLKLFDGGKGTIALRIPKYKFLNNLLKKINKPLAQTSVNVSDKPALIKIKEIEKQFGKQNILLIDGGNISKNKPSQVVDLIGERLTILR